MLARTHLWDRLAAGTVIDAVLVAVNGNCLFGI